MKWVWLFLLAVLVAAGFYFYTPDISHDTLVAKYGQPPSKFIELSDGSKAHYRERGEPTATPVLLIHGSNTSLYTWEAWSQALAAKYHVYSVDMPGHGLTGRVSGDDYSVHGMEQFITRFADAVHIRRFILAGNSMGGGIAVHLAAEQGDRVIALILVDAFGVDAPGVKVNPPLGFKLAQMPIVNNLMLFITPRSIVAEGLRKSYANPALVTPEHIEREWALIRHPGNRYATLKRFSIKPEPINPFLSRIHVPTLVLWGEKDQLLPLPMGQILAKGISGAKLVTFPNVGHMPHEEAPKESVAAVLSFLSANVQTGLDVLRAYEGTWLATTEQVTTNGMRGPQETKTLRNACWRQEQYFSCDQIVDGKSLVMLVYTYDGAGDSFNSYPIPFDGSEVHKGKLYVNGNVWTFPWKGMAQNKLADFRVVNTWADKDHIDFRQEFSIDGGKSWTLTSRGKEERLKTP